MEYILIQDWSSFNPLSQNADFSMTNAFETLWKK